MCHRFLQVFVFVLLLAGCSSPTSTPSPYEQAQIHFNRGVAFHSTGDYDKAIAEYDAAIGLAPDNPRIYNDRASSSFNLGDTDSALNDLNYALDYEPGSSSA